MAYQSNIYKKAYQSCNGQLIFTASTGDTTLETANETTETLCITKIIVTISTSAAQSIQFEDSASSARYICKVPTSPTVDTQYKYEFGEVGLRLTTGKNLVMNVSAAGNAGHVIWEGYRING